MYDNFVGMTNIYHRKVIHASLPSHSTIPFVSKITHTSVTVIIVHNWQGVVSREPTAVTMLYLRYQCNIRVTVNILFSLSCSVASLRGW